MPSLAGNRNEWLQAFEFYFVEFNSCSWSEPTIKFLSRYLLPHSRVLDFCGAHVRPPMFFPLLCLSRSRQVQHPLASYQQMEAAGDAPPHSRSPRPLRGDSFCRAEASLWQEAAVPAHPCCPPDSRHRRGSCCRLRRPRPFPVRVRVAGCGWRGRRRARCPERGASRPAGCRGGVSAARQRRPR